ncbi:Putative PAS domain, signal transduction response regulator, receiver domain, CheY-like superfamily [Septoria linicola]|uniref:histidine kinase n=1 Tax=Septoria linicola TaxID=215465 RepID=A0A9Q9AVN2_9PEZI|nr:putative PAS domain, signal transduction response regulator, receiver domain, CheY-like superfamily [Septoria linicola]USW52948.1 Putative PAS domain, signal transduction response regulator, receiver domain, CheY-like superfamily [Septoria linicola]
MHDKPAQYCISSQGALECPPEVDISRHSLKESGANTRDEAMKQITPAQPAGEDNSHVADHDNPLPGSPETWKNCSIGKYANWSAELRGYVATIAALTYPAAVFWDGKLTLFHNKGWADVGGLQDQGQELTTLTAETREVINSVKTRGIPKEVQGHDFLRDAATSVKQSSTAIVSPLLMNGGQGSDAVLVQLLPRPMLYRSIQMGAGKPGTVVDRTGDYKKSDEVQQIDNAPLDEHPFFRRFAEMLPSGLAILDHNAHAIFVNQHFYDLTTMLDNDDKSFTSWPQSIHPDDYERVMDAYKKAFSGKSELRAEFRARGEPHPWRLLLLTPLDEENLQHVSLQEGGGFICSIVDISSEKSAELNERKAAQQARERKEQQERFIDMISHEIRNPLSAVLHCAEDIGDAIQDKTGEEIDTSIIEEAVETITLCVSHQKNIVDDVLSFSKLDASLLSLHPKPTNPSHQLAQSLKMFQHEFRKEQMQFGYRVDESYQDCHVRSVLADMPRIGQVLINLITNAIKFTRKARGDKRIICSVAASVERPKSYPPDVVFFQSENLAYRMDATNSQGWGSGDPVYVMVAVKDTGIGISAEGQQKLFERFRQATPKTEEVYGGSGLGLNISRKICHLHGGEIGVSSKEGEGSTFGFFFKVKRCDLDAETADGLGEEQIREQIKHLGMVSPSELERTEPFDWTPESRRRKPKKNCGAVMDGNEVTSKDVEDEEQEDGQDLYSIAERPEVSRAHRSGTKLESEEIQKGGTPEQETKKRPIADMKGEGGRAHVLLVEDNIINQRIVFRKLEAKGFNVTTANNGQEAVDAVRDAPKPSSGDKAAFDVILMDQEMPIMDGNTACKKIRALETDGVVEHIPMLGVTANVRGAQKDEMIRSGMQDVISKPYKIEDMVDMIESVVNRATMKQEGLRKGPS